MCQCKTFFGGHINIEIEGREKKIHCGQSIQSSPTTQYFEGHFAYKMLQGFDVVYQN